MSVVRRSLTALIASPLALVLAVTAVPNSAEASPDSRGAGASGIGDPYWPLDGNGGIDVASYRIRQSYALGSGRLRGRTTIRLTTTQDLSRFNLDFLLPVRDVRVDGARAKATTRFHELRITPSSPLAAGTEHTVVVRYAGVPEKVEYADNRNWLASDDETVAMNQPHIAPWWFPANDHPSDKATFDVTTRVARGREVIGNGDLVRHRRTKQREVWRWRAKEPMATYLAFFAVGNYAIQRSVVDGLPVINAVSRTLGPKSVKRAQRFLAPTGDVVNDLAADLGPYPFSSTGGLVTSLFTGFALENQTRPTYPYVGARARSLLVHELAHQWFGDSVAVARWRDIWLNEGAATFMEWRDLEVRGGATAAASMRSAYDSYKARDDFWRLTIADPGPRNVFHNAVYERGAMTLQALRNRIGDEAFFRLLRTWLSTKADGNGTSEEFEALAAQISGIDLTAFFTAWLRTGAKPASTAELGLG